MWSASFMSIDVSSSDLRDAPSFLDITLYLVLQATFGLSVHHYNTYSNHKETI